VNLPADLSPLYISLATTCAATVATFFLGMAAARLMYGVRGSLRAWIDGVLTLPLVLPPTVVGFFLLLLFGRRSFVGHALQQVGITIVFSWPATVIAATVVAFPLMYRTTLGAFDQVNRNYLDAARTLGASEGVVFRRVLLPLAAPGVLAGTVLAFARAMGEFGATLMLAGNIPGRTQTMPIAIFSAAAGGDMREAFLWVGLIVVISLGIIRLLNRENAFRKPARNQVDSSLVPAPVPPLSVKQEMTSHDATLDVYIEKTLEQFELDVRLCAGSAAVGLLGASGAGKTMTLRMIAGIAAPDRGRIVLNNRVLFDGAAGVNISAARRKIGVVFQDYALFPHMTVAENVGFGLRAQPAHERQARVQSSLSGCTLPSSPTAILPRFQAGSGSAWPLRDAWPLNRMRCCSTSRLQPSIRTCAARRKNNCARPWQTTTAWSSLSPTIWKKPFASAPICLYWIKGRSLPAARSTGSSSSRGGWLRRA
jgi:molybdate ABC transporter permease protein